MRAADVKEGIVVNVLSVDAMPDASTEEQWLGWGLIEGKLVRCLDLEIGPGASYDEATGKFTPAQEAEPK